MADRRRVRNAAPDISVLIPTRGRPAELARCLEHLSRQTLTLDRYEVLVGVDGPDEASTRACEPARRSTGLRLDVVPCPRLGVGGVKNELLPRARGRFLVFTNDDVYAEPGFLDAHLKAQREAQKSTPAGAMVLGDTPWVVAQPDRLFDRLVRETSMVFFYDQMPGASDALGQTEAYDPSIDWGFRHAWNLNLSAPASAVRSVGGFYRDETNLYGYEDLELAWKLTRSLGMPVLFRPDARGSHDHRYEPEGYLARERRLGHAAFGFALACPDCARATFGRDVAANEEVAYCGEFLTREARAASRLSESFRALAAVPATAVSGAYERTLVRTIYEQHLLLKRYSWRQGLMAAASGAPVESV